MDQCSTLDSDYLFTSTGTDGSGDSCCKTFQLSPRLGSALMPLLLSTGPTDGLETVVVDRPNLSTTTTSTWTGSGSVCPMFYGTTSTGSLPLHYSDGSETISWLNFQLPNRLGSDRAATTLTSTGTDGSETVVGTSSCHQDLDWLLCHYYYSDRY
ncbi:hypothetical protein JCM33374_g1141 [Metschnikowia sp. JCM 33374]|nr:hypothetical protein JCM33374_g1141 [Metschnikowia sp. JCM 33374]